MAGAAYIQAPGRPHRAKTARRLWGALRRNIPAYVGPPSKRRFYRPRVPKFRVNPEATPKRVWDVLLASFVLYTTCVVPYRVCFRRDAHGALLVLEHVMDVAFGLDIVLNFFTGIYLPSGDITYSMRAIATEYVRGWFFVDFFSTMQFEIFVTAPSDDVTDAATSDSNALMSTKLLRSLKVLKLFKLARVRRLGQMFSSLEDAVTTNQSAVSLVKLALSMLFFAHIVACIWYAIGAQNAHDSWILGMQYDSHELPDEDLLRYLASMYWAIVTMGTIGYGDIVATNNEERLANVAVMAIGVSFFGYVMGTISTLVTNLDVTAALYDERMTIVKEYILSRQIPKHMSKKVRDHFEYYYQNHSVFQERKILERLPSALRNEMIHHVYAKLVTNIKYFTECHESLVSDIVMLMHPFSVLKNEFVYVQHEIAAHVFFLLKGKVYVSRALPSAKGEVKLATHSIGEHFGEMEVYDHVHGNGVRMCSAIARSFCELTFLSREAILKLSERWPEVLRHFQESAHESSKRLRQRAGAFADDDMYSLFRDHTVATAMIQSSVRVRKSVEAVKGLPGRISSRISPFVSHDDDDDDGNGDHANRKAPHRTVEPHHHHFVSGNFDARSTRSARAELPLAQCDDDVAGTPAVVASFSLAHPSARQPSARLLATLDKPRESEVASACGSSRAAGAPLSSPSASAPAIKPALFQRQGTTSFADISSDGAHKNQNGATSSTPAASAPFAEASVPAAAAAANERADHADRPVSDGDDDVANKGGKEPSRIDEQSTLLQSQLVSPEAKYAVLQKTGTIRRDLQSMVEKLRSTTVPPAAQQTITAELLLLKGTYIFHPQEPFIVTWQFIVGLAILYSIVVVPLRLGFTYEAVGGWFVLELAMDSLFLLDIVITFRTAFVNEEKLLIHDARVICRKYARSWFVPDLLSTIPFDDLISLFYGASDGHVNLFATKLLRLTRIVRLLKLMRLVKLSRVFGKIRDIIQISPWAERLVRLMVMMLLFCHWNACLFHAAMLASESAQVPNWCEAAFANGIDGFVSCSSSVTIADRYVASMYWAFTTLTTVGYGDIRPSLYSVYELGLVIVLIVVNATFFGYIVSSVMDLIQNFDPSDREYKLLMTEMKDYMRESSASVRLCSIVKVHYKHNISCTSLFPEQKIFDRLSPSLRFDLARLVAGETLFAIPLITVMEDAFKGFVSYALFRFKPMCIVRSEKVCRSGGPGTEMFFLVDGECDLVNSHTGAGRVIGENSVFEQYALMAKPEEIYRTVSTVTALTKKCILYSFSIQDFKELEDVSPAVSTYFLSQLAAVLVEDDLFTLSPTQRANVNRALRSGNVFRSVAEHHQRTQLNSLGKVALAKLYPRRGSEWSPDLLPRQLKLMSEKEAAAASRAHAAAASVAAAVAVSTHDDDDAQVHSSQGLGSATAATMRSTNHDTTQQQQPPQHFASSSSNSKVLPALRLPAIKSFAADDLDVARAALAARDDM